MTFVNGDNFAAPVMFTGADADAFLRALPGELSAEENARLRRSRTQRRP